MALFKPVSVDSQTLVTDLSLRVSEVFIRFKRIFFGVVFQPCLFA